MEVQLFDNSILKISGSNSDFRSCLGLSSVYGLDVLSFSIHRHMIFLQDGLGDTIRVSLTEAPEEEIDPCTKLANLGMKISAEQKGVVSLHHMFVCNLSEHWLQKRSLGHSNLLIKYVVQAQVIYFDKNQVVDFNLNMKKLS